MGEHTRAIRFAPDGAHSEARRRRASGRVEETASRTVPGYTTSGRFVSGCGCSTPFPGVPPPLMSIDALAFRHALGRFASGVTVVTMRHGDDVHGITVSAFLSLSLAPPLIGVAIDERATAHALLASVERFGVSVLAAGQETLSERFAGRPVEGFDDPFEGLASERVIRGALAQLVCRIVDRVATGDHTLVVGEIEALALGDERPLVYFRGAYQRLA